MQNKVTLAPDHTGIKVDHDGLLTSAKNFLQSENSFISEGLSQLKRHLNELGQRYYAGDTKVVDEFLQLYCVAEEERKAVKGSPDQAQQAQQNQQGAQQDTDQDTDQAMLYSLVKSASKLSDDIHNLIGESTGVSGLHRNGDEADWESLMKGGQFEEWLGSLDDLDQNLCDVLLKRPMALSSNTEKSDTQTPSKVDSASNSGYPLSTYYSSFNERW